MITFTDRRSVGGCLGDRRRRRDAALDRDVDALDAQPVEQPRPVADDQRAGSVRTRHRVETAFRNHLRAIGDGLAAADVPPDRARRLVSTKDLMHIERRVYVVESERVADHHAAVAHVIDETTAIRPQIHRIAEGVHDRAARARDRLGQFDQLLDGNRVALRTSPGKALRLHETIRENACAAFGEHGHLRSNLLAREMVRLGSSVRREPLLARARPDDDAVPLNQLGHRITGVDLRPETLGDRGEVASHLGERADGKAVRLHHRRHPRDGHRGLGAEDEPETLAIDVRLDGQLRDLLLRQQFAEASGIHDRAGEDVTTDGASLVDDDDTTGKAAPLERNGSGETGRARAHDQNVRLDHFRISLMSAGMISVASPTMPRSATPKIGALGSVLTAMTRSAPRMPSRCWMAPEMPKAR